MAFLNRLTATCRPRIEDDEPACGEGEEDENVDALLGSLLQASSNDEWTPLTLTGYGPETRTILIAGEINTPLAAAICSQLSELDAEDSKTPIKVVINSPGGDVIAAFAIYDMMRSIEAPIITLVQGMAFSGGFLLLQGGDLRLAFPNSRLFYHEPLSEAHVSSVEELEAHQKSYVWGLEVMNDIIQKRAGISKKVWNKTFANKTALFFTTKEALELNLLDDLIEFQTKAPIVLDDPDAEEASEPASAEVVPTSEETTDVE
jgi:ATP-dependent Clp endopeptidase proteolytic subunit ClpP